MVSYNKKCFATKCINDIFWLLCIDQLAVCSKMAYWLCNTQVVIRSKTMGQNFICNIQFRLGFQNMKRTCETAAKIHITVIDRLLSTCYLLRQITSMTDQDLINLPKIYKLHNLGGNQDFVILNMDNSVTIIASFNITTVKFYDSQFCALKPSLP